MSGGTPALFACAEELNVPPGALLRGPVRDRASERLHVTGRTIADD